MFEGKIFRNIVKHDSSTKHLSVWFESVPEKRRFPVLQGEKRCDVVIVGGGIAGVTAAWHLCQQGVSVILLEKNHIATGDTGLTTGFITRLPEAHMVDLQKRYGDDFPKRLLQASQEAQQWIFHTIQAEKLDCDFTPCDSFVGSYDADFSALEKEWAIFKNIDSKITFEDAPKNTPFRKALHVHGEGKFNVRKYLFGLLKKSSKNLEVYEESEALEIHVEKDVKVKTQNGLVTAQKVLIAMGNPALLFPELENLLKQKITSVVAAKYQTVPLNQNLFWDTLDPYFYYRMADDHTLILGGCDRLAEAKSTSEDAEKHLREFLQQRFAGDFEITHSWSGSILETADNVPYVFPHPFYEKKVWVATGWGGTGIVFGTLGGTVLAESVSESHAFADLFDIQRTGVKIHPPAPHPSSSSGDTFVEIAKTSDFGKNSMICRSVNGKKIALFQVEDNYYAVDNACSHAGGSLSEGILDGKTIQCPLHGARFDVMTGTVMGPPAIRSQKTYTVKLEGERIILDTRGKIAETSASKIASFKKKNWADLQRFTIFALAFWFLEFFLQYRYFAFGDSTIALLRSFSFTGATFISFALFLSAIFKWLPKTAKYWRTRRHFGVAGFLFGSLHVLMVEHFVFQYDLKLAYWSLNPLENPVVFMTIGFPIFFVMAITSSDWALQKLGSKLWKRIHQLVYLGFWTLIFHFLLINPPELKTLPGYVLQTVAGLALFGELFWFIRISLKKGWRNWGLLVGTAIIFLYAITVYFIVKYR